MSANRTPVNQDSTATVQALRKPRRDSAAHALALTPLIRRSLAEFHKVTGLVAKLVPAVPPPRPIRFGRHDLEFCRRVWTLCEGGCVNCHHTQQELFRKLDRKLKPQSACCEGGIVQLAVPVMAQGKHVATIVGGKVRLQPASEARFQTLSHRLGFPRTARRLQTLRQAYFEATPLTPCRFREAARLLDSLACLFGEAFGRQSAQNGDMEGEAMDGGHVALYVTKAKTYVREHLGEPLTTRHLAKVLNLSESYFCRLFRRFAGMTFHAYLAQARVEAAKQRLLISFAPITEICYVSGFQSVSDFNRVFKAKVGTSPSKFRRDSQQRQSG